MTRSLRLLLVLSLSTAAFAQTPTAPPGGQAPPAGQARRPIPAPTNLKVLPKDMTGQQVVALMRLYERQLGVECEYCHAKDPATGRNNFASDANTMKDRARVMMKMTASINADFLTQLTDPKPEHPVDCGTCHRGMSKPAVFVPRPGPTHPARYTTNATHHSVAHPEEPGGPCMTVFIFMSGPPQTYIAVGTTIPNHPNTLTNSRKSGCPIFATVSSSLRWASRKARPLSSTPPQIRPPDRSGETRRVPHS